MDWFYTKTLTLMQRNFEDVRGTRRELDPTPIKDIRADVQPASREMINKQYGYQIDCTQRAFCKLEAIDPALHCVQYKGVLFNIPKAIEWDNYLDILLKER